MRRHLHELDPARHVPSRGLRRHCVIDELLARLAGVPGVVARLARGLLGRCREPTARIDDLEAFQLSGGAGVPMATVSAPANTVDHALLGPTFDALEHFPPLPAEATVHPAGRAASPTPRQHP